MHYFAHTRFRDDISGTKAYSILNYLPKFIMLREFIIGTISHVSMTPFQLERMFTYYILVNNFVICQFGMFF